MYSIYESLACSIFDYSGLCLPYGVTSSLIEKVITTRGKAVLARRGGVDNLYLFGGAVDYNEFGVPVEWDGIALYGSTRVRCRALDGDVVLTQDPADTVLSSVIRKSLARIDRLKRRLDSNADEALATPLIYKTKESKVNTVRNMHAKRFTDSALIMVDKDSFDRTTEIVPYPAPPYHGAELRDEIDREREELLRNLGVLSSPVIKAERVNLLEITSGLGYVLDVLDSRLKCRREQIERYNQINGTDVQVNIVNETARELVEYGGVSRETQSD